MKAPGAAGMGSDSIQQNPDFSFRTRLITLKLKSFWLTTPNSTSSSTVCSLPTRWATTSLTGDCSDESWVRSYGDFDLYKNANLLVSAKIGKIVDH